MSTSINTVDKGRLSNARSIKTVEKKLAKVEEHNKNLQSENMQLKEKLLDVEYRQRRNNLIFEGVADMPKESDLDCIAKVRSVLRSIPGIKVDEFRIDRCYRLDGAYKPNSKGSCRILCAFNWYYDVQCILHNRKCLPKGVYVSEDLPEEWVDRCKVLKPIYNAVRCNDVLKMKTHLNKDKLVIDGKFFTASGPNCNLHEVNAFLDTSATCQKSDENTVLFLGSLSPLSSMYSTQFTMDNVTYNSTEQFIQSQKAALFDDDLSHAMIMKEENPYKMKKLGSKVKHFSLEMWRHHDKSLALKAVRAKFNQNSILKNILLSTGDKTLAESSMDYYWGSGIHLHDKDALDKSRWKSSNGGVMSEILAQV